MSHDQTTAQIIRTCHHIAELSNADLCRASARKSLLQALQKALRLLATLETPNGGNIVAFNR